MTERADSQDQTAVDDQVDRLLDAAAGSAAVASGLPAARDSLDLQEQEIKDAVLRMGSLVEEAIRRASRGAHGPRRRPGARHHQGRRPDQRRPARGLAAHQRDDRHPATGRA